MSNSLKEKVTAIIGTKYTEVINQFFNADFNFNIDVTRWCSDDAIETRQAFIDQGISVNCVESHGGEDQGRDFYSVYKFSTQDETVYIKFQGWYASYNGSEFEEWNFVEPVEKMITVYE